MNNQKLKKIGVKALKIVGGIVLFFVVLLLLVALAIQLPVVQEFGKRKAISFLEDKIGTTVRLDRFSLSFPKMIVLSGLYLEDQKKDTLVYAGRLGVDTDLFALTRNTIELNKIQLEDFVANINRAEKDSAFNFDYIVKAFASDTTTTTDTTASNWNFSLGKIQLEKIKISFQDHFVGNHVDFNMRELAISMDEFDLNAGKVGVDEINIDGLHTRIRQTRLPEVVPDSAEVVPEDSTAIAFDFSFNEINITDVNAFYQHTALGTAYHAILPEAVIEANAIDLKNQFINLSKVGVYNSQLSYVLTHPTENIQLQKDTTTVNEPNPEGGWRFALDELDLRNNSIRYTDNTQPTFAKGFDRNHVHVTGFTLKGEDIRYGDSSIGANITNFAFTEQSGFKVEQFKTSLAINENSLTLKDFLFKTGNSTLALNAEASFASLKNIAEEYPDAALRLNVTTASFGVADVLTLYPAALDSLPLSLPSDMKIESRVMMSGRVKDLLLERFYVTALDNTVLSMNGKLVGLPDTESLRMNVVLQKLYSTRADLQRILPDTLLPESIVIPEWFKATAELNGTIDAPVFKTRLTSEYGNISLKGHFDNRPNIKENYSAELAIDQFALGKLLGNPDTIGNIDMQAHVVGSGIAIDALDARLALKVNELGYGGYTYRDFIIDGSMKKYFFSGIASMKDENLNFTLTGDLDYNNDIPNYAFVFDLKNADFQKLLLSERPLRAKGRIDVDLATADFRSLNGSVGILDFGIYNGEALYTIDSLLFASIDQVGHSEISIDSEIIKGNFEGTINIFSLSDVLSRHFNRYYSLRDTVYDEPVEHQNFRFDLTIKNTDLITNVLLPDLKSFIPGEIAGNFDSRKNELNMRFRIRDINYSDILVDSVSLMVLSNKQSFDFTFSVNDVRMDTIRVAGLRLAGNVMNDSIRTNFMITDTLNREKYFLGGVFYSLEDAFQFSFLQKQVMLNYKEWDVPLYNSLTFTDHGLEPNNFLIKKGNERILLLKKNNTDSTLSVMFNEVDLANLTNLIEGTTPLSGFIDGELNLGSARNAAFRTDLKIKELGILDQQWGDLALILTKAPQEPVNFKLSVDGVNADLKANGYITQDEQPTMLIDASLPRLNLAIIEPLSMGQLRDVKGRLAATLRVEGPTSDPTINGRVSFHDASFLATAVNNQFKINNQTILIDGSAMRFNNFQVQDSRNALATIDGVVDMGNAAGIGLNLDFNANKFQLLNSTVKDNEMFYGNVLVDAKARIRGTSILPKVQLDLSIVDGSNFTYVVPSEEKGVMESKGVVVFVDRDAENDPFLQNINLQDTITTTFSGFELNANIALTDKEVINVVIDPATGDQLTVQGNANLTLQMTPTGDMQMSGRYEITEGTYNLSFYKLVKRQFSIGKGSSIIFAGDPMNANMDIRAIYEIETAPIDLVANELPEDALGPYKQKFPFYVYLNIKGQILAPEISFALDMPEEDRNALGGNVYAKLQDVNTRESALNKQVFALLILQRFISENPLENRGATGFASSARSSVSKILSDQLNRLSSNVKGVELSFDLKSYEDFSTGEGENQTDLQLGLSKSLMNDRLVVKVSGNVRVEGEQAQQNSFTDFIGDLALEYKLTEDGRFRVTGFRNNDFDLINGQLINTGVGLIYIKDYDSLRELFKSNAKTNK